VKRACKRGIKKSEIKEKKRYFAEKTAKMIKNWLEKAVFKELLFFSTFLRAQDRCARLFS
jgi:hypothetical protein